MDRDYARLGQMVKRARIRRYRTVDAARGSVLSRGAWDNVEHGRPAKESNLFHVLPVTCGNTRHRRSEALFGVRLYSAKRRCRRLDVHMCTRHEGQIP